MAFDWDVTNPDDSDVVSQFPANERSFRTASRGAFAADHDADTTGYHNQVTFANQDSDPTIASGLRGLWCKLGALWTRKGSGTPWSGIIIPTGAPVPWFLDTIPTGWYTLNGQAVSRTGLPLLFALWGTTFGVGDGSTTFNLPDARERVLRGVGPTYSPGIGATQEDAIKSHDVDITDPGHQHSYAAGNAHSTGAASGGLSHSTQPVGKTTGSATTGITAAYTGEAETRVKSIGVHWIVFGQ